MGGGPQVPDFGFPGFHSDFPNFGAGHHGGSGFTFQHAEDIFKNFFGGKDPFAAFFDDDDDFFGGGGMGGFGNMGFGGMGFGGGMGGIEDGFFGGGGMLGRGNGGGRLGYGNNIGGMGGMGGMGESVSTSTSTIIKNGERVTRTETTTVRNGVKTVKVVEEVAHGAQPPSITSNIHIVTI